MTIELLRHYDSDIEPNQHPYMNRAWTPNHDEYNATDMEVLGEIPEDIDGVYLRNTENQLFKPIGRFHPFDGDGMIHMVSFRDGKAEYRNRFVQTKGLAAEVEAGRALWAGLMERPDRSTRPGWGAAEWIKDASSTDVIVHAGQVLSTFYQCGEGYRLDPYTLEQYGPESWVPLDGISAHPKLDEHSGELLFFNYSKHAPYMHYGEVGPDNKLTQYRPIPLPGPRLPHDMAFTKSYAILNDLPMFWDPDLLERGVHAVRLYPDLPSRFAIVPRRDSDTPIRWFEADPTYVLHWLNAYEEGDEIVLDGYFQDSPQPGHYPDAPPGYERLMAFLDQHLLKPRLHRWRFNLVTGATKEERLDDRTLEFGIINQRVATTPYHYAYSTVPKAGWFLFEGAVKHDMQTGKSQTISFGKERYGSEAGFAPRVGGSGQEDDGYLITFVTDMIQDRSECVVFDASSFDQEPVCRIVLPHRISSGTHATWAHGEDIRRAQSMDAPIRS